MKHLLKEYIARLDELTGGAEPKFYPFQELEGQDPVYLIAYNGIPEDGHLTGFTFGVSDHSKPEWIGGRPELIVSVKSSDISWLLAVGELAAMVQRKSFFGFGTVLDFQEKISDQSEMSAFLIFANTLLDNADSSITLPDRKINWSQAYPIYSSEIEVVSKIGSEKFFFDSGIDFYNIYRDPFVV